MDAKQLVDAFADPNELVDCAYGVYADINYYGTYGYLPRKDNMGKHEYNPRAAFLGDFQPFLNRVCEYINAQQEQINMLLATRTNTIVIPKELLEK